LNSLWINPLDFKGNYSATLNNTQLAHWPLMCGLSHLVQREGAWAGWPVYQSPYCYYDDGPLLCSFNVAIKGLMV